MFVVLCDVVVCGGDGGVYVVLVICLVCVGEVFWVFEVGIVICGCGVCK